MGHNNRKQTEKALILAHREHGCKTKCYVQQLNRQLYQDSLRSLLQSHIPYPPGHKCHFEGAKASSHAERG